MKRLFVLLVALFAIHLIVNSQPITMSVEGGQGKFESENQNNNIALIAASLEVTSPGGAGIATGRRQHQPFVIKKAAGGSSPQFLQAMISNEILRKIVIEFRGVNQYGEEAVIYRITLENARVSSYKQSADIPENTKTPKNILIDEIQLTYQKITAESISSNRVAKDDTGANTR